MPTKVQVRKRGRNLSLVLGRAFLILALILDIYSQNAILKGNRRLAPVNRATLMYVGLSSIPAVTSSVQDKPLAMGFLLV